MRIPYSELSTEALRGVIEEFISREGSEYGEREYSMEEKVTQIMGQLARGTAVIEFDPDTQTCQMQVVDKDR